VNLTLLVVDDHETFRRMASRLFAAAGFTVVGEATDGASALQMVRVLRPDVVLLDVILPDTDGFAVAESLATARDRPQVVLVSSRSADDLSDRLRAAPVCGFVTKSELTVDRVTDLLGVRP
jgi:CheY-like chemotaxis protein